MSIPVSINEARTSIERAMRARLVPMLQGSPGTGKSQLISEIAGAFNLKVIDLRLAQCDPTDLLGFPTIDEEKGEDGVVTKRRAGYVPMETFPLEGDPMPEKADGTSYDGWLLFLDELPHADRAVQKASYKLVLDRMVGVHKLHRRVAIVAAGNLDTDNAFTEELSTAMQSRLVHLELKVDNEQWLEWALGAGIDHRITSYLKYKPTNLHNFDPDHSDKTFPSPRTWEFASRIVRGEETIDRSFLPLLAGTVGEGTAREFLAFTRYYAKLLTFPQIIGNPGGVVVPTEPGMLFALTGMIAHHASDSNIADLMVFVDRLPVEFQVVTLRDIRRRVPALIPHPAVQAWMNKNAKDLF